MPAVEIEYCVPCGHLERAEEVQHELLSEFGQRLDRVGLKTGDSGVFVVRYDDEVLYDKSEDEGSFDVERLKGEVNDRLEVSA